MAESGVVRRLVGLAAALGCLLFAAPAVADPFTGTGMWIWQLAKSERGSAAAVAARAAKSGVSTVIVKAADGPKYWPQFSSGLVAALHARGVQACAYQFLYGRRPGAEAAAGARAVASGADCLIVDVEGAYAGRYSQLPPSPPHLFGQLHHHAQLRPLLLLGEQVSFLGRGKAALRR